MSEIENKNKNSTPWNAVTKAKTPINIFAMAMMACASILGASATFINSCESLTAFTYTIHAFIAISGMFFLTLLFCRKGIYHPQDLSKVSPEVRNDLGKDNPIFAAILIAFMMLAYGYYQYKIPKPCQTNLSEQGNEIQTPQKNVTSKD